MRTTHSLILASFLVAGLGLLAGCSTVSEPSAGPQASTPVAVKTATPGDYAPRQLYSRAAQQVALERVSTSTPSSPRDRVMPRNVPEPSAHSGGFELVPPGLAPSSHTFVVDSTEGDAYLFLSPHSDDPKLVEAALSDIQVLDPAGVAVNVRPSKGQNPGVTAATGMSSMPLSGLPIGVYTVNLGATASNVGVSIDVRQPQSSVVMQLTPDKLWLLYGDDVGVDVELTEAGIALTGASLHGNLVRPSGDAGAALEFVEVGHGHYRAFASKAIGVNDPIGAYRVQVYAGGKSSHGTAYQRFGTTGLTFAVPTAKVTRTGDVRVIVDGTGQISAFEVDVDVQAASLDRYSVSGVLAAKGADGYDHPVAEAQVAEAWASGTHTMTLHFDAGHVRMTGLEGSLALRNLQLYSQGTNSVFYRAFDGGGAAVGGIQRMKLARVDSLTPSLDQMVLDGVLRND